MVMEMEVDGAEENDGVASCVESLAAAADNATDSTVAGGCQVLRPASHIQYVSSSPLLENARIYMNHNSTGSRTKPQAAQQKKY